MATLTAGAAPPSPAGLTKAEVEARVALGQVNVTETVASRSLGEIVRANVVTRFNALLGVLFVLAVVIGPVQDTVFAIVPVLNTLIGIVQELRAKRALDRLALLTPAPVRVLRDGKLRDIDPARMVVDDIVEIASGDQLHTDGVVVVSHALEIDESLLTGESLPAAKQTGAEVLSGTFAVAGTGRYRVTKVGEDAYARRLAAQARHFETPRSDLRHDVDRFLTWISWLLPVLAVLLIWSQLAANDSFIDAARSCITGLVAYIPQGLVLLTSMVFAVAVLRIARHRILVQDLAAVEMLARVDTLCLDKTGTLTDGRIVVERIQPFTAAGPWRDALAALAAGDTHPNASMRAVATAFAQPPDWRPLNAVPFTSARGWSGATFDGHGTWVLGAPEIVAAEGAETAALRARTDTLARAGRRVVLLSHSGAPLQDSALPPALRAAALVVLREEIRPDAAGVVDFLRRQGTRLIVISGDNPVTAAAIAEATGIAVHGTPCDARELPEDDDALAEILETTTVFGRVSPQQKQRLVRVLQEDGHVVAMTGDGVNDVLALKRADVGIAMGSGSPAARAVSRLVLVDSAFAAVPRAIEEGRRSISNLERVAALFLTKTTYAVLLSIAIALNSLPFPLLTRQLSLVDSFTVGIPAFFLALAPAAARSPGHFIRRTLTFALPAGAFAAVVTFAAYRAGIGADGLVDAQARTLSVMVLSGVGLWIASLVARPFTPWRVALFIGLAAGLVAAFVITPVQEWFALVPPALPAWTLPVAAAAALIAGAEVVRRRRAGA